MNILFFVIGYLTGAFFLYLILKHRSKEITGLDFEDYGDLEEYIKAIKQ